MVRITKCCLFTPAALLVVLLSIFILLKVFENKLYELQYLSKILNKDAQYRGLECWDVYFMQSSPNNEPHKNFIPSSTEEATLGISPSIPTDFLIEEEDYCSKRPSLRVIACINSAIKNVNNRDETRKTWASASKQIGTVFLVGRSKNEEEMEIVRKESEVYHDIIQGNFTDLYNLLTYKSLSKLHWFTKNCNKVPWVINADDDVLIDVFKLLTTLEEYDRIHRFNDVLGELKALATPLRNPKSKWVVSYEEYPCGTYPPYCIGSAWFTSMSAIETMIKTVPLVKYLSIDDIFITGFLTAKSGLQVSNAKHGHVNVKDAEIGEVILWIDVHNNRPGKWLNILHYYSQLSSNENSSIKYDLLV